MAQRRAARYRGVASDLENARRLVVQHGEDIRFSPSEAQWRVWNGMRWEADTRCQIEHLAKDVVRGIQKEADRIADVGKRIRFLRAALAAESYPRLRSMVSLARSEPGIPIGAEQLDTDPWLFNVRNGTLDLKTGTVRPHRREDLITKLAPVAFDPRAECPTFLAFLDRIMGGAPDLVGFLQKIFGYCLTGDTSEQCFFIFYGTGANGKSTLLNTVRAVLGDYAKHARTDTLLARRSEGIGNDIARLAGARFVDAVEAEGGRHLAEAQIKQLTGGDIITARFLFHESFEFKPAAKFCLAVNHKPMIKGTDHAIWRRVRLVPFEVTIPEGERDKQLAEKLLAELPGVLAWLVRGCLRWQAEGLEMPAAVKTATETYRGEMDVTAQFLAERCLVALDDAAARVSAGILFAAYSGWCAQTGHTGLQKSEFGKALAERGFTAARTKTDRYWCGLTVLDDDAPTSAEVTG